MEIDSRDTQEHSPAHPAATRFSTEAAGGNSAARHRRASNRWLAAAIAATLVTVALSIAVLVGIQKMPSPGLELPPVAGDGMGAEVLTVAVARTPGGPSEWTNWARVIKYISEDVGMPVSVRYLTKEDQAPEVIASEKIDLAFVCAHHYLDLTEGDVVDGLCTPVINGEPTTTYMLVVRADDPARRLEDLAGAVVAASDKSSLGGYSYLSYICKERDLVPAEFFGELRLGETQDSDVRAVLDGSVRATVVASSQMVGWDTSGLRVIEQSVPVGCPPVVASLHLDPAIREAIRESLLSMEPESVLPAGSNIEGFVPLDPDAYAYARLIRGACGHHTHE